MSNIKRFVVASDCAANANQVVVQESGTWMQEGTVLWNARTDDYALVDSKPKSNKISITKSALGSTGQEWKRGDQLWAKLMT